MLPPSVECLAYTLQTGRDEMPARLAIHEKNHDDLCNQLKTFDNRLRNALKITSSFFLIVQKNKVV
jgi:acyl transferase domain-containing protein